MTRRWHGDHDSFMIVIHARVMTNPRTPESGSTSWRRGAIASIALIAAAALAVGVIAPAADAGATAARRNRCSAPAQKHTGAYRSIPGVAANATSLDVYRPARTCGAPVVMWVHGGGYHTGDKRNQVADKVRLFNSRGWVFVSVNYRLTVAGDPTSAHYPDHYEDVAAAVAWVQEHIKQFGGDGSRIALLGHSAGADIVSNVTTNPQYLGDRGLALDAVDCAGPLDTEGVDKVTANAAGGGEKALWQEALGNAPDYERTTSAITWIRPHSGIPPTIGVVRGAPVRRAIQTDFLRRLTAAGIPATQIDATGLSHGEVNTRIGAPGDTVMTPPLAKFLETCFRSPR